MPNYFAIVPAAGIGSRMQNHGGVPKQYIALGVQSKKTILEISLTKLLSLPWIDKVCVALNSADEHWQSVFDNLPVALKAKLTTTTGGDTRADSVIAGMQALNADTLGVNSSDWVLVHDAARPCVLANDINALKTAVELAHDANKDTVGGILTTSVTDTIKQQLNASDAPSTIDRETLYKAQTPQMFLYSVLYEKLTYGLKHGLNITDEASAIESDESLNYLLIESSQKNIKLTQPDDLFMIEAILNQQGVLLR